MNVAEFRSKRDVANDRDTVRSPRPPSGGPIRRRLPVIPVLVTLATVALAAPLCWAMWNAYMGAPWTRDSTVRTYVVTKAPEVAGRIVELPVADNQFVHKGDLLLVIDPTDFRIALEQAEATMRQAQANVQNFEAQIRAQQAQVIASEAQTEQAQAALTFAQQQAARYRYLAGTTAGTVMMEQQTASTLLQDQAALKSAQAAVMVAQRQIETLKAQLMSAQASVAQATAQRGQARVNLERTQIRSPVNGWITNLLVRVGDYAAVGRNVISIADADSFWVDAYFEETQLASVREGDPAEIKLMGYREIVRGQVGGVARAIDVPNADPNHQGVANVNPIFTWVRLAQRVPVRIQIDQVPEGVRLVAGMTATVQVDPQPLSRQGNVRANFRPCSAVVTSDHERPIPIFQQLARSDPSRRDYVRAIPNVAAHVLNR
jgi:multidrug resistance efflux pump